MSERTDHPRETIDVALAHVVRNRTEAAYARSDSLGPVRAPTTVDGRLDELPEGAPRSYDAEHDDGAREDFGQAVPLLDELSYPHSAIPACAGSARTSDPVEDDTAAGASHDDTRDHLPAVVPTLDEFTPTSAISAFVGEDLSRTLARTCPAAQA